MIYRRNYPETVDEVVDDSMTFDPKVIDAMKRFRASHAWTGTREEKLAKFRKVADELAEALEAGPVKVGMGAIACYSPSLKKITLNKFSVVSLLHEFGHHLRLDEREACRWSINLFKLIFPKSFDRLDRRGHMLVRRAG